MKERTKWAFILDKDEFFRLSLSKILRKYGFTVEEIDDFSQLEKRKREIEEGMVIADVDVDVLEKWAPLFKRWSERFIVMTPLVSEDLHSRLKRMGIRHIIKKPVEPKRLRKVIQEIPFFLEDDRDVVGKEKRMRVSM
jgi:FixJ family two-component response regulator